MATRSARLSAANVDLGATATAIVTAAADEVVLVKSLFVSNTSAGATTMTLGIGTVATGDRLISNLAVPAGGFILELWLVLMPSDVLVGTRATAGVAVTAFGAILPPPPP